VVIRPLRRHAIDNRTNAPRDILTTLQIPRKRRENTRLAWSTSLNPSAHGCLDLKLKAGLQEISSFDTIK
jgi:hypothetical protein